MDEPVICVRGNVAGEPELRYSPNGKAVLNFSLAQTPRKHDRSTDQWIDGTTQWYRITCFGRDAENAAESIARGSRVMALGRLEVDEWTDKAGQKRTSLKLLADEVGLSTKWAAISMKKVERSSEAPAPRGVPVEDPWLSGGDDGDAPF